MKRTLKTLTSIALVVLMVLSTLSISAFAATSNEHKNLKYKKYTYLGDSIPFGYGLVSQEASSDPFSVGVRVQGSYTDLVGDVLEASNHTKVQPAASSGSRVCDYRILFERGLGYKNPYDRVNDWYGMRKPERTIRLRAMGPDIVKWLSDSDLVTFQCGLNDITACLINAAYATGIVDLDALQSIDGLQDVLNYLVFAFDNLKNDPIIVDNFLTVFAQEVAELRRNIRIVMKELVQIAPENADILVVGYHKAVQGIRVIPGTDRSFLFDVVDEVLMSFNSYYRTVSKKYGNVYYVDAPDAEVVYPKGTTVFEWLSDTSFILMGVHPSAKGHKYIAKQVINKLDEINS